MQFYPRISSGQLKVIPIWIVFSNYNQIWSLPCVNRVMSSQYFKWWCHRVYIQMDKWANRWKFTQLSMSDIEYLTYVPSLHEMFIYICILYFTCMCVCVSMCIIIHEIYEIPTTYNTYYIWDQSSIYMTWIALLWGGNYKWNK